MSSLYEDKGPMSYVKVDEYGEPIHEDTVVVAVRRDYHEPDDKAAIFVLRDESKVREYVRDETLILYRMSKKDFSDVFLKTLKEIDKSSLENMSRDADLQVIHEKEAALEEVRRRFKNRFDYRDKWYEEDGD